MSRCRTKAFSGPGGGLGSTLVRSTSDQRRCGAFPSARPPNLPCSSERPEPEPSGRQTQAKLLGGRVEEAEEEEEEEDDEATFDPDAPKNLRLPLLLVKG